jgi:preprotein translocase subunit SecA
MNSEDQRKWIEYVDKNLLKVLKTTEEYKAWQDSLMAIVGYTSNEEQEDEELAVKLVEDHLSSSFELQKGLENARFKISKKLKDEWLLDNSGQ